MTPTFVRHDATTPRFQNPHFADSERRKKRYPHMKTKQTTTTDRLGSYLTAAIGIGTLAGTADAAIVTFSNSGSFIEGTVDDGDQPTIIIALGDGSNLLIDPYSSGSYLELTFDDAFPYTGRFTGVGTFSGGSYPGISLLGFGDPIFANNSGNSPYTGSLIASGVPQSDFVGNVSGYIGFVTPNNNKGWLSVEFNSDTGLFAYNGGAVATMGEDLTAGATGISAVPEPASTLSLLGLLSSGLLLRQRRNGAA